RRTEPTFPEPGPARVAWLREAQQLLEQVRDLERRSCRIQHRIHGSPEELAISYLTYAMVEAFELCARARAAGGTLELATALGPIKPGVPGRGGLLLRLVPPPPPEAKIIDFAVHLARRAAQAKEAPRG